MTRIKECLDRMGQTQKWLALTLGVKQPSVHDWITGKNKPTAANLQRLAALFQVSTDYLLGPTDDPTPAIVSADTWDVGTAFSDPQDDSIRIMARGMGRLSTNQKAEGSSPPGRANENTGTFMVPVLFCVKMICRYMSLMHMINRFVNMRKDMQNPSPKGRAEVRISRARLHTSAGEAF